jgi:glucan biosynthesis protein C
MAVESLNSTETGRLPTPPDRLDSSVAITSGRLLFVDNIRWTMVILVLTMHATDTYSPFGNWYYTDRGDPSLGTVVFFAIYQSFLQAFFMGLLFFVAGYFTMQAWRRKNAAAFIRGRFVRLGIPTLLYMLLIGPLTQYFLSHTWGTGGFAHQWLTHLFDGQWLSETGPMWFCAALFIFSLAFVAIQKVRRPALPPAKNLPGRGAIVAFIIGLSVSTFLVRIISPENKSFLNVHLGDFPQYILMFSVGIVAYRGAWLARISHPLAVRWSVGSLLFSIPLLAILIFARGSAQVDRQAFDGGYNFVSAIKCLWEAFVCFGMSVGLLAWYRRAFDHQSAWTKYLSDNAFAVYLFHPPVLIAIALTLRGLSAPALVKDLMLSLGACVATFALSGVIFRRLPLLRNIL